MVSEDGPSEAGKPLCFVLMPFGRKPNPAGGPEIDFDRIYESAIRPGIDDAGLGRKRDAVESAVRRISEVTEPTEILREVGGCELVAMAAAIVAARHRSIPVVLDGYICTASALALHQVDSTALDHCLAGHRSAERGHGRLLDIIGKPPILELDMRLGEGSGAMAAVPLVRMACAGVVGVATFAEWFGDGPGI